MFNGLLVVLSGILRAPALPTSGRFREEMLFADLEIVANRLDKLKDLGKKTKPAKQREAEEAETALLLRISAALEKGEGGRRRPSEAVDEEKAIRSFQLLDAEGRS